jgi:hypothetical protein
VRRREVDQLVLAGAPADHVGVLLRRTLDDDLLDPPDAGLVLGERRPLDHDAQPGEPLATHGGVDEVVASISAASVPGRGEKMKV